MKNSDELLIELQQQEKELQFDSFSNQDAISIGLALVDAAKKDSLPIVIDITRAGQVLFHAAMPETSPDNDQWIIRKNRTVGRFHSSSFMVGRKLEKSGSTMEEKYLISSLEYAAHGGAFPIRIKNTGVVGTITVSGLAQEDDHALVVKVLRTWLNQA